MTDDDIALKAIIAAVKAERGCAAWDIGQECSVLTQTVQDALAYAGVTKQLATIRAIRKMNGKLTRSEWAREFSAMGIEAETEAATLREKLEVR